MKSLRTLFIICVALLVVACANNKSYKEIVPKDSLVETTAFRNVSLPIEVKAKKLTIQDGLPSNVVTSMLQDQKGFLWLCTHNGLARYDGNGVVTYDKNSMSEIPQDGRIKYLTEDRTYKKLWIYTASEFFICMDLKNNDFENFLGSFHGGLHFTKSKLIKDGLVFLWGKKDGAVLLDYRNGTFQQEYFNKQNVGSDEVVHFDTISATQYILSTKEKVYLYANKKLSCLAQHIHVARIRPYRNGALLASEDGKVYELRAGKLRLVAAASFLSGENVKGELLLSNRWILLTNKGTLSVDLKSWKVDRNGGAWDFANGKVQTDSRGRKWIFNKTGILRCIEGDSLLALNLLPNQETNYIDYERFHIAEDNNGLIWISTYGNGLFVFNHNLTQSQHFVADERGESPIASNYLLNVMADRRDGVWVSSEYGGVSHIQVMDKGVERIFPNEEKKMDFSNVVRMIRKLSDGDLMVSTRDGWLYRYSPDMRQMKQKWHFDSNVYALVEAVDSQMWIGTRGKGVYGVQGLRYDNRKVFCMTPDLVGNIWIGTFGTGLNVASRRGAKYEVKTFFADSVGLAEVRCLAYDRQGTLWVGTSGGLIEIEPRRFLHDSHHFKLYRRNYEIHDLCLDKKGNLFLAVPSVGVVQVKKNEEGTVDFKVLDNAAGLINNMVQTVVEATDGSFWIATQQGVSCWNPKTGAMDNYLFDRNPMGNVYNENSAVCLNDGRVLLGGNYGLTLINPSAVRHAKGQPDVVFTSSPYSDGIELSYKNNSPQIDFSTLDYSDVNNVKYTYWLEGYDKSWSTPSSLASASYKNLSPGRYIFHAKACSSDGAWGKESLLVVRVLPPFYLSVWAMLVYFVLALAIGALVLKNVKEKNALRNKIKLEQELTKYKLVFFTNIAHEFRTPLTLIQGSLERERQIMRANGWQAELEKSLLTMDKSVRRMLRLINQLLEFRKMQAGKLKLSLQETEVVMFVKNIFRSFSDTAESKQIDYRFEASLPSQVIYLDQQKMDKVVFNLLSNAFKYTPSHGKICLSLDVNDKWLMLRVADSGVGIPADKRVMLFSRFMQSSYTGDSFGIGLHLTHELVDLHHGGIAYEENPGGGSVFSVKIPLDKNVYEASDFLVQDSPILKDKMDFEMPKTQSLFVEKAETPLNRKRILLVEDDDDVREFLASELRTCFDVKTASDGKAGLAMAKEEEMDLIVSDVMMPGVNGFELTKRLKHSFETSHIPIILLTALSTEEHVLEGTESGADAYMTKPFSPKLLVARIFQLLDQREKLKQKFGKDLETVRPSLCATDKDQLFVKRLDAIIYQHLNDTTISVDLLAEKLHLGRTLFYRKVRGVTGYTPNDYIRVLRLRKAAELLREGEKNVSEVAFAVGFDNPYYFSKRFKEQFGVPPSKFS